MRKVANKKAVEKISDWQATIERNRNNTIVPEIIDFQAWVRILFGLSSLFIIFEVISCSYDAKWPFAWKMAGYKSFSSVTVVRFFLIKPVSSTDSIDSFKVWRIILLNYSGFINFNLFNIVLYLHFSFHVSF